MKLTRQDVFELFGDAYDALDWEVDNRVNNDDSDEDIESTERSRDLFSRLQTAVEKNPAFADAVIEALKENDE